MKHDLIYCSSLLPGSETDTLLLVESIRHFGGKFADKPIWLMTPEIDRPLNNRVVQRLQELSASILPFPIEKEKLRFFFTAELTGLAYAESLATAETDCLVWMDANTIVVNEPKELYLPDGVVLGYRPVQHLLVGSRYDTPLDPFWSEIYRSCNVPLEHVFPMRLTVEELDVRPYFNAGFLVLRPQSGLLQKWLKVFNELCQSPVFQPFYEHDKRYIIFMHQAVLAGVVLSSFERSQLRELPRGYNYPLDLFKIDQTVHRPRGMDEVVTFRHEGFYEAKDWRERIPASDELKSWLSDKISLLQ